MTPDDVRYARHDDLYIAFKVTGAGPPDIVLVPGLLDTIEGASVHRAAGRYVERLAAFARVIRLDKRGTGLSDRLPPGEAPTVEARVDDVLAVMDAADVQQAAIVGAADGGAVAMVLAATRPERVSALVLTATAPRLAHGPDWPWGVTDRAFESRLAAIDREWGTGMLASAFGVDDEDGRREFARLERLTGTPTAARQALQIAWETDVRSVLGTIRVPTLVMHHTGHRLWPIEGARYVVEHIADARLVELPGQPETLGFANEAVDSVGLVEEFLTGRRASRSADRVLRTVLFTDIVDSTGHVVELGDRRWRERLDEYDDALRRAVDEHDGTEVNTAGDGHFVVFEGPARAIRCARAIVTAGRRLGLETRAGLHTGECEVRGDDLAGLAVHIGARVGALAAPGEVLVTSTVRDLVAGSGLGFDDRGRHALKGVPGEWQLLAVV